MRDVPPLGASALLELARVGDLRRVGELVGDDTVLRAAVPTGVVERVGPAPIASVFEEWFGGVTEWRAEEVECVELAERTRLRWRVRVRFRPPHDHWFRIEQVCFVAGNGAIRSLDLACSGFARCDD